MSRNEKRRILIVEPYYGGSHRAFLDGLQNNVEAEYTLLSLPARKWKMRMQLSAPWFAERVADCGEKERYYNTVLCSTFVDVAVLRSLLIRIPGWNPNARFCTYFHENQFVYPGQISDPGMFQFSAINFLTAVASDSIAFNSRFNQDTFLRESNKYIKKASDMSLGEVYNSVVEKSCVLYPGINYSSIDRAERKGNTTIPVIVWNHRWEHDKNPDEFFRVLASLKSKKIPFRLIILGESFIHKPICFDKARKIFADELIHYGYAESPEEYAALLRKGDLVISTSIHEFFGISVLEAVRAGCYPLLPKRLSYPELFPVENLYSNGMLDVKLEKFLAQMPVFTPERSNELTEPYSWAVLCKKYEEWLFGCNSS
jgi:glycosyltransferase involved in cell wall biosynthesis